MTPEPSGTDGEANTQATPSVPSPLLAIIETSVIVSTLRGWGRGSKCYTVLDASWRRATQTIARWGGASLLYTGAIRFFHALDELLQRWVRNARLYRWLTADPDPNVIVIDLREARTLAPLLSMLDRALAVVVPAIIHARTRQLAATLTSQFLAAPLRSIGFGMIGLAGIGFIDAAFAGSLTSVVVAVLFGGAVIGLLLSADRRSWNELWTTTLGQLLVAIFVPPEPPISRGDKRAADSCSDDEAPVTSAGVESRDSDG